MGSPKGYGQLNVRKDAIERFKKCREPDETRTDTLNKLVDAYEELKTLRNRKCPASEPGIIQT
jgi:hypothetical protein